MVRQWIELQEEGWTSLVLGNGASMAFSSAFGYSSLLQKARAAQRIGDPLASLFGSLNTEDFEQVLRILWHARLVNDALGIDAPQVGDLYAQLRDALIDTVAEVHPNFSACEQHLETTGEFLKGFERIISFNYDFLAYWVILRANGVAGGHRFKDCFVSGVFDTRIERLSQPIGTDRCSLVFYPHGNIALLTDGFGNESKINAVGQNLMETVFERWRNGVGIPLFVSEGTARQKLEAIHRSHYLSFVYDTILADLGDAVVVYGLSFSENDGHVIDALTRSGVKRMAVSVYTGAGPVAAAAFCLRVQAVLAEKLPHVNLDFVDSASPGLWLNPA